MEFKTEAEMQFAFIEFLEKQGYPRETIKCQPIFDCKTAKIYGRFDLAIVVADKMIQAFEVKRNVKTKGVTHAIQQVGMYEELMDSVKLSAEIHIVTHDDGKWWVFSKQKQRWLKANILSFDRVASELYIKANEQIVNKTTDAKPNFKSVKWICWLFSGTTLLYLVSHITLHALRHCKVPVIDLPLTPEIAMSLIAVVIGVLLPLLLPFVENSNQI